MLHWGGKWGKMGDFLDIMGGNCPVTRATKWRTLKNNLATKEASPWEGEASFFGGITKDGCPFD